MHDKHCKISPLFAFKSSWEAKTQTRDLGCSPQHLNSFVEYNILGRIVVERFHLDSAKDREGTIWFTLVVEDPINYFVEQYHDSKFRNAQDRMMCISRDKLRNHIVNGIPLITLVENKLAEIAEAIFLDLLKSSLKKRQVN